MSTLVIDGFKSSNQNEIIPFEELGQRVIKTFRSTFTGGPSTLSTSYNWVPGCFTDYTPESDSSIIRFSINLSTSWRDSHAIGHFIFYANGDEQGRHNIAGQYIEQRHLHLWDVPSWGTSQGRIGYQARTYGTGNELRVNSTQYWNGGGTDQAAQTELVIEEYLPI